MKASELLHDIGRPVAYFPALAPLLGGAGPTLFFSQLFYWNGKEGDARGLHKTQREITAETGLTEGEQNTAREKLRTLGILREHYARLDHKMFYKLDLDRFDELLQAGFPKRETPLRQAGNPTSAGGNPDFVPSETTAETTTETLVATPPATRQKQVPEMVLVDEPFRELMRKKYSGSLSDIDDRINEALNHKSALKWPNQQLHVRGWLRRDAERALQNGRKASVAGLPKKKSTILYGPQYPGGKRYIDEEGRPVEGPMPRGTQNVHA